MRRRREPLPATPEAVLELYHRIKADAADLDEDGRRVYINGALSLYGVDVVDVIRARRFLRHRGMWGRNRTTTEKGWI